MKKNSSLYTSVLALVLTLTLASCTKTDTTHSGTDLNGYKYTYVQGDMTNTRVYKLNNGLTVYLSKNPEKPRINTAIAVNVGSQNDPTATTGLAHYFEHIMFKGSDKLGTANWPAEKVQLAKISELFEKHNAAQDPKEKDAIYHQIDSVSNLASNYAIANEYDKAVSSIGATGTNAYTSYDRTVFINDIAANEVSRWLQLEDERFEHGVIRLFHTELEAVYEEFNMSQDRDQTRVFHALLKGIFPTHPYGRPVIGWAKDLKNPSIVNIEKFRKDYYVANNIAICMSGDLNYEKTIKSIDKYWGNMKSNPDMKKETFTESQDITQPEQVDLYGPEEEFMMMGFRTPGARSKEVSYLKMIDMILSNSGAGLIDLDLVQKQKVLGAFSSPLTFTDYGVFLLGGNPRAGQSMEDVKTLLLQELDKIKKGDFDEWQLKAAIKQFKLRQINSYENNGTTDDFVEAFVTGASWKDVVDEIGTMDQITKADLVKFANDFFKDNYYVVYKHKGENKTAVHMDKPKITPVAMNRDQESDYFKAFKAEKTEAIKPVFLDFKKEINKQTLGSGVDFYYTYSSSPLAYVSIVVPMGTYNDPKLGLALDYLNYLGTDRLSPSEVRKEFYKLGLNLGYNASKRRLSISVSGLDESMDEGVKLMEEVLSTVKADTNSYHMFVDGLLRQRANAKMDKRTILFRGLIDYAKYGPQNPFTNILSEEELRSIKPQELVDIIKNIRNYPHLVYYYGPRTSEESLALIKKYHPIEVNKTIAPATVYTPLITDKPQVYFCDYDMVQTHLVLLSRDQVYDPALVPAISLFGQYYGGGMASIVFQELREARSLAYAAQMNYMTPGRAGGYNYIMGAIFTQPDKMSDCLKAFTDLLNKMPYSDAAFQNAREAIIKNINTERITKDGIFGTYLNNKDLGIDYDIRKNVYDYVQHATLSDVQQFFDNRIKNRQYIILVLGKKSQVDFTKLKAYGPVKELTLKELFGY